MIVKIIFFILCSFIYLDHVTPAPETNHYRPFKNSIEALRKIDVAEQLTKMFFKCPEEASTKVIELMNTKHNPKVSDVLDAFNEPFDSDINLFILRNDNILLDIEAFEIVLYRNYQTFINKVNPFNFNHLNQPEKAFLQFKREIKFVSDALREAENKLPVEKLVTILDARSRATGIRERWTFNPKCKCFIDSATKNIRTNLSEASKALTVFPFAEIHNVDVGVGFLKDILSYADDIVSLTSNICDIDATRELEVNKYVTTRGVVSIIEDLMGLISSNMNTILISILNSIRRTVENVFNHILAFIDYLQNIVNAVYPCTLCGS